jgi:hypothetical protein
VQPGAVRVIGRDDLFAGAIALAGLGRRRIVPAEAVAHRRACAREISWRDLREHDLAIVEQIRPQSRERKASELETNQRQRKGDRPECNAGHRCRISAQDKAGVGVAAVSL